MNKGLFDNVPIVNKERDEAWAAFIRRKDVKELMSFADDGFGFPLGGGYYDLWCIVWAKAWDAGFYKGWDAAEENAEKEGE
ncbi:hypothetical protein EBT31_04925 [bacterium]|jgi:hypothetical protein|nr:hypothetical protein [bacterium]